MKLIGINGRMLAGKDAAFKIIRSLAVNEVVERRGFADKMKLSGVRALGYNPSTMEEALEIADEIKNLGSVATSYVPKFVSLGKDKNDGTIWAEQPTPRIIPGREFWQRYGAEAHREVYGSDFHVDALLPQPSYHPSVDNREADNLVTLRRAFPDVDVLCITDVRFLNEAERVLALGGKVVWVDADERLGPLPPDSHISEHPLPEHYISYRVTNNGTLEEFETAVASVWERIR